MINELKPCPFCGRDVELSMSPPIVVRCRDCKYGWQLWEKPKGKGLIDATQSAWNARAAIKEAERSPAPETKV